MGGLFSYSLVFNHSHKVLTLVKVLTMHILYTLIQFHQSTNKALDVTSRVSFFPCRRNRNRLGDACVVEILCMYKFSMWIEIKTKKMLRPDADMSMAESSGGSGNVRPAYTAVWPVKVCVIHFALQIAGVWRNYIMLPCLKAKTKWSFGLSRIVVGGFKMHKRAVRVSSMHGPPSMLLPTSQNKTFPLSPGFSMWARGWTEQKCWNQGRRSFSASLRAKVAFESKPMTLQSNTLLP